ncbi:MAG: sodium:proton antiporter [Clostridiales Family XIII bacterium]|jgi:CPA1 family monovalent cation:H+ antiporter|nr:sodium:proton antiporter [Clostridiales Family XIII bacterium]
MEQINIIIVLILTMVLTNILDSAFDSLPMPLIQIGAGVLLGMTVIGNSFRMEPEVLMALVIAPLLFRESEEADLMSLWRLKKQIFLMAFLLVFITVITIGLAVHLILPSLPLAACFALGAVLGPTDYVAVASLSSKVTLPDILITVLKGEALINDASGLISLRFAVAALMTGVFSIFEASIELVILCVGGLLVGQILTLLKRLATETLRRMMIHYTDTYLLLELLLPFLSYVVAELCGVSGILAAVMAGTLQAFDLKRSGLFEAELGISKKNLWEIVCFILNSLVFLVLGMELPSIVIDLWENPPYPHVFLIIMILTVTFIMMGVRFLSLMFLANDVIGQRLSEKLKNTLILTLSGVKGVVSMASAVSLPFVLSSGLPFVERSFLLFIAAGTILLTLVLALFLLPLLIATPPGSRDSENKAQIELLREVVKQLQLKEGAHLGAVIVSYRKRIKEMEHAGYENREFKQVKALRGHIATIEMAALASMYRKNLISRRLFKDYQKIMDMMKHVETAGMVNYTLSGFKHRVERFLHIDRSDFHAPRTEEYRQQLRDLFWDLTDTVVQSLENRRHKFSEKLIAQFIEERIDLMGQLIDDAYSGALRARLQQEYVDELLVGYEIERETIWDFYDNGRLTESQANELRVNVNTLESYTLSGNQNDVMLKLMSLANSRRNEDTQS